MAVETYSLQEMEREAQQHLDRPVYDYFAGGADDERTRRANETAFARIGLLPRVLRGAGQAKLEISLLGHLISFPVTIAPTAFHRLAHPEGERATARAAAAAGTIMIVSMASTIAIEEVAAAANQNGNGNLWFQIYLQPDLAFTRSIIERAEAAGCSALVVTVDSPTLGNKSRDVRNGFRDLPQGMCCENLRENANGNGRGSGKVRQIVFSPAPSWKDVEWLRSATALKIVLKGIVHPEDARLAVEHGVDAVVVSNHGGRQLDGVPATIDLLPAIVRIVGGRIPLLMDGGIRRGTDVLKALALGATAVAVGRPILWGLALAGQDGVRQVLEMLRSELERALTLCGCGSVHDVSSDLLQLRAREKTCLG